MQFDIKKLSADIDILEKAVAQCPLPRWDDLPTLDLYMDQVVVLLNRYLAIFNVLSPDSAQSVTATMINNYVKLKTIPAPIKKKYSRRHIAFLIIVCTLKQTHSMSTIQGLVPLGISDDELILLFNELCALQEQMLKNIGDTIADTVRPAIESNDDAKLKSMLTYYAMRSTVLTWLTRSFAAYSHAVPDTVQKKNEKPKKAEKAKHAKAKQAAEETDA